MTTQPNIKPRQPRWIRRILLSFLLLASLYALSRTVHAAHKTGRNDTYVLPMPGSLGDNSLANQSFADNRGNIAIPASLHSSKSARP